MYTQGYGMQMYVKKLNKVMVSMWTKLCKKVKQGYGVRVDKTMTLICVYTQGSINNLICLRRKVRIRQLILI
jgi:hypothetical protein